MAPVCPSEVPEDDVVPLGVSCEVGDVLGLSPEVGTVLGDVVGIVGVGDELDDDGLGDVVPVVEVGGVPLVVVGGVVAAAEPLDPLEPPPVLEPAGDVGVATGALEPPVGVPVGDGGGMAPGWLPPAGGGVSVSHGGVMVCANPWGAPVVVPAACGEVRRVASPEVQGPSEARAEERPLTYGSPGRAPGEVAVAPEAWVTSSDPPLPMIPVPVATVAATMRPAIATVTSSAGFLRRERCCLSGMCSTSPTCSSPAPPPCHPNGGTTLAALSAR
ncbi:MAG TPA: hypothetical protein VFX33_05005 [Actinomycetales bacterium]|nr:hypothetical protein [Actinomycetales bacterium]